MCLCKPKSMAEVILLIQISEIQSSDKKVLRAPESCNQEVLRVIADERVNGLLGNEPTKFTISVRTSWYDNHPMPIISSTSSAPRWSTSRSNQQIFKSKHQTTENCDSIKPADYSESANMLHRGFQIRKTFQFETNENANFKAIQNDGIHRGEVRDVSDRFHRHDRTKNISFPSISVYFFNFLCGGR